MKRRVWRQVWPRPSYIHTQRQRRFLAGASTWSHQGTSHGTRQGARQGTLQEPAICMCVAGGGGAGWQAGPDACHSLSLLQGQLLAPARLGQRTLYTPHTGHQDTPGTDSLHSALESCMKMETCGYQASSPSCSFTARQLMLRPNTILVTPTLLIRHKNGPPDMAGNQG